MDQTERFRSILKPITQQFEDAGAMRLFLKVLAPNDNSKNQIYLGGNLAVLQALPFGEVVSDGSTGRSKERLKAPVPLHWIASSGHLEQAKGAQLILYPQYPEVRLSGILSGCRQAPSDVFRVRDEGRLLLLGVDRKDRVLAIALEAKNPIAKAIAALSPEATTGALTECSNLIASSRMTTIFEELSRIHQLGWIDSRRLDRDGRSLECGAPQCVGYTLEAELGVRPNSKSAPDFDGWEVKAITVASLEKPSVHPVTLMTPEPDGGWYAEEGVVRFLRKFGYKDTKGRKGRINFSSPHHPKVQNDRTGLTLVVEGADHDVPARFSAFGKLMLLDSTGLCAASWSFAKLLEHWRTKHRQAVFVPAQRRKAAAPVSKDAFRYGRVVGVGQGTDFGCFLRAVHAGAVYYDPGIKLTKSDAGKEITKRRSQFRIKCGALPELYHSYSWRKVSE